MPAITADHGCPSAVTLRTAPPSASGDTLPEHHRLPETVFIFPIARLWQDE
jgi:hypothetical protein